MNIKGPAGVIARYNNHAEIANLAICPLPTILPLTIPVLIRPRHYASIHSTPRTVIPSNLSYIPHMPRALPSNLVPFKMALTPGQPAISHLS